MRSRCIKCGYAFPDSVTAQICYKCLTDQIPGSGTGIIIKPNPNESFYHNPADDMARLALADRQQHAQTNTADGVGAVTLEPNPGVSFVASASGVKYDQEKPDMSLLSAIALEEIAKVMTCGKKKYGSHNWRGGFIWSRPLAAAMRHLVAFIGGEDKDPETGLSHLAHCACCLFFLLEFEKTKPELDDRYKEAKK